MNMELPFGLELNSYTATVGGVAGLGMYLLTKSKPFAVGAFSLAVAATSKYDDYSIAAEAKIKPEPRIPEVIDRANFDPTDRRFTDIREPKATRLRDNVLSRQLTQGVVS